MFQKSLAFLAVLALWTAFLAAQENYRPANSDEAKMIRQKIEEASASLKSLRCEFEQTKTLSILEDEMHSSGFMTYRSPDILHWEYVKPDSYVFDMKGERVILASDGRKKEIDASSSRLFKEVRAMVVAGINGKGIFDEKRFTASFQTGTPGYRVQLTPKQKAIKQLFEKIALSFDKDCHIYMVELTETGGDQTVIRMTKREIND